MDFEKGQLYHIYNQGNNGRQLFFERDNYIYFLNKIHKYILPYCDIIAWCLMPNHFHFMIKINHTELFADSKTNILSQTMDNSHSVTTKKRTLNTSIGYMLRSYARAINKKNKTKGSLFRAHTKAICLDKIENPDHTWYTVDGVTQINVIDSEKSYPQICFEYIHNNPTEANLVKCNTDWEFSSAIDYAGKRNGRLVNKIIAKECIEW
jgi:putative transposase